MNVNCKLYLNNKGTIYCYRTIKLGLKLSSDGIIFVDTGVRGSALFDGPIDRLTP